MSSRIRDRSSRRYKSAPRSLNTDNDEQAGDRVTTFYDADAVDGGRQDDDGGKKGTSSTEGVDLDLESEWWTLGKFTAEMNPGGLVDHSQFIILFPSYRELYLKQVWPLVDAVFSQQPLFLRVTLNAKEGNMVVETTERTFDPVAVITGRDVLLLMSRGMSFEHARKLMEPDVTYDVIKIKSYVRKYETFMNRRQRLLGPNGATLKAIELLTACHVLIQGKTVSVVGPVKGIKEVRRIVIDCMENIHPIYHVKQLMVKRELEKNKALEGEDWSKYMPQFRKNVRKGKKHKSKSRDDKKKKKYTPFPPPPTKSKMDIALETGEYFMTTEEKEQKQRREKEEELKRKKQERMERRAQLNVPPEEKTSGSSKKKSQSDGGLSTSEFAERLRKTLKQHERKQNKKRKERESTDATDFVQKKTRKIQRE